MIRDETEACWKQTEPPLTQVRSEGRALAQEMSPAAAAARWCPDTQAALP